MQTSKLPLKTKLTYSMGNFGIATVTAMHMQFLVYFFFPPKDSGIPYFIPQESIILGLTVFGLIVAIGKFIDAIFDPIIANFSDGLRHKLGRRIPMMRFAALPFALCYLSVFFVPNTESIDNINVVWLACSLFLSAMFFTSYMIPFYSLLGDIAKTTDEKVELSTLSSAFWIAGYLLVSFTASYVELFEVSRLNAFKITFSIMAFIGLVCLMVPAFLIDENKLRGATEKRQQQAFFGAVGTVLKNRNFRFYLGANTCYNMASIIFESGFIYFLTILALMSATYQGPLTTTIGALTLLCYPLVSKFAKKVGKIMILRISLVLYSLCFLTISSLGIDGIHVYFLVGLSILLSPFVVASFGILPLVVATDSAQSDKDSTGKDNTAMYVAANGFSVKLGAGLGLTLFTSFLMFGKDVGNDLGIRMAAGFGASLCLLGFYFMLKYKETSPVNIISNPSVNK